MRTSSTRTSALAVLVSLFAVLVFAAGCADDPVEPDPKKPPQIPTSGLIAFYPFNTDAQDASGNDNHASLLGAAAVDKYLTLGSNAVDRVALPYSMLHGAGDFTISVWGRITTVHAAGDHTIISGARTGMDNVLCFLYLVPSNGWDVYVNAAKHTLSPGVDLSYYLEWHHFLVLRSGATARFYLDGVQVGDDVAVSDVAISLGTGGLLLGQDQDSLAGGFDATQSWAGDLDNLRIYNRALNATDITALASETGYGG